MEKPTTTPPAKYMWPTRIAARAATGPDPANPSWITFSGSALPVPLCNSSCGYYDDGVGICTMISRAPVGRMCDPVIVKMAELLNEYEAIHGYAPPVATKAEKPPLGQVVDLGTLGLSRSSITLRTAKALQDEADKLASESENYRLIVSQIEQAQQQGKTSIDTSHGPDAAMFRILKRAGYSVYRANGVTASISWNG